MTHPTLMQQQAFELLCHVCQQRGWLSPIYEECEFTLAKRLCIQHWNIERKADEAGPAWCVWVHATKGTVRRMPPHSLRPRITAQQGFVLATMELQQLGYDPFVAESYTMEATKWGWLLKEKKTALYQSNFFGGIPMFTLRQALCIEKK